jgi:hypothetical protein
MLHASMRDKLLIAVVSVGLGGAGACAPRLGDGCTSSQDCSVNGDRYCDRSQPGGYCTIADCSPGSCGDEGYCVRFNPDEQRLSRDFCMAKCGNDGDCDRDRYVCRSAKQLNKAHEADPSVDKVAEVIDSKQNGKFCVVEVEE